jgi:hypothetical protein
MWSATVNWSFLLPFWVQTETWGHNAVQTEQWYGITANGFSFCFYFPEDRPGYIRNVTTLHWTLSIVWSRTNVIHTKFCILATVTMKSVVLWSVTPWSVVEVYRRFRGSWLFRRQEFLDNGGSRMQSSQEFVAPFFIRLVCSYGRFRNALPILRFVL